MKMSATDWLLKQARIAVNEQAEAEKQGFVDPTTAQGGGAPMDPAMMGAPMAGPPGAMPAMDPAAAGGAPPMDPAMMGMDPAMMGGAPPMDPAAAGGAPPAAAAPDPMAELTARLDAMEQQIAQGGSGGAAKPKKGPKQDPALIAMQTFKLVARMCGALGIEVPATDLLPPEEGEGEGAKAEGGGEAAAAGGGGAPSAIGAIEPMPGASPDSAAPKQAAFDNAINGGSVIAPPTYSNASSLHTQAARLRRALSV